MLLYEVCDSRKGGHGCTRENARFFRLSGSVGRFFIGVAVPFFAEPYLIADFVPDFLRGACFVRTGVADGALAICLILVYDPVAGRFILIDAEALRLVHVLSDKEAHLFEGHVFFGTFLF